MLCLMGAVDDATGELLPGAHFVEQECAAGYLHVLKAIAEGKGLPWRYSLEAQEGPPEREGGAVLGRVKGTLRRARP